MYPEEQPLVLEPGRIHRILRKLLGKVSDLEEEVLLRPSVYRNNAVFSRDPRADGSGEFAESLRSSCGAHYCNKARMPPAHPFQHLIARGARRAPRYTYRRSRMTSLSESEYTDIEDGNVLSAGTKRGRPKALSRSSSVGALSDDTQSQSSSQDPALWLTTPRKRLRRRASETGSGCDSSDKGRPGMQPQSFGSRLEKMITSPGTSCANTYKARSLHSHLVGLGELLWLGGPSSSERCAVRVLPLTVLAGFRLGEAVAASDGCSDLEYLDEVYGAMPVFLVRFALWQHIVTLCYLRIPAYADTLSEALWDVGAFHQQQWLIGARLADLDTVGALLKPACVVPLHLRAADIGAEQWFVDALLERLSPRGLMASCEAADAAMRVKRAHALWREFVLPGALPSDAGNKANSPRVNGSAIGAMPSRFSKWVARISNSAQSVRLLAAALEQALLFLADIGRSSASLEDTVSLASIDHFSGISCYEAVEAVRAIASLIYTKLGYLDSTLAGSDALVVLQRLQQCVVLLDRTTGICQAGSSSSSSGSSIRQRFSADVVEACAACQIGLVLLALRQLGASRAEQPICSYSTVSQVWAQMANAAKKLLQYKMDSSTAEPCGLENIDPDISKRSMLVARFDSAMDGLLGLQKSHRATYSNKHKLLDVVLQNLTLAGASPAFFYDVARLVAYDLKRPRTAQSIVAQTLVRFDLIWVQHRECCSWQLSWTQLQAAADCDTPPSEQAAQENQPKKTESMCDSPMDELELWEHEEAAVVARSRLEKLGSDLDRHLATNAAAAAAAAAGTAAAGTAAAGTAAAGTAAAGTAAAGSHRHGSNVKAKQPAKKNGSFQRPGDVSEDELGLLLSLGGRRRRSSPTTH